MILLLGKYEHKYQSGSFSVINSDYKKDPGWTAAIAAYKWIEQIKMSFAASDDFRMTRCFITEILILRS